MRLIDRKLIFWNGSSMFWVRQWILHQKIFTMVTFSTSGFGRKWVSYWRKFTFLMNIFATEYILPQKLRMKAAFLIPICAGNVSNWPDIRFVKQNIHILGQVQVKTTSWKYHYSTFIIPLPKPCFISKKWTFGQLDSVVFTANL